MAKKFVACRLPIGTDRDGVNRSIEILNEEFSGKVVCELKGGKVLMMHYENDTAISDLVSIGMYIGRNLKVKS